MLNYKPTDKFSKLRDTYPKIADYLYSINPLYKMLTNNVISNLMAPKIDIKHVAQRGNYTFEEFMNVVEDGIKKGLITTSKEESNALNELKQQLKSVLKQIYNKENVEQAKKRFKDLIEQANPVLIAVVESELKNEGYSTQDLMKACDVHMELFKEQITSSRRRVEKYHPLYRLIKDHDAIMLYMERGLELSTKLTQCANKEEAKNIINQLKAVLAAQKALEDNHNTRQENTLFPVLEKYGVEEPPAIMWQDHSNMKQTRHRIEKLLESSNIKNYIELSMDLEANYRYLLETFALHTKKEQEILYNVALDLLSDKDWQDIQKEEEELGFVELPTEV